MKKILLAMSLLAFTGFSAAAACTPAELQQKATDVSAAMQAAAMKNPQATAEWSQKMQEASAKSATSMDEACAMYDEMLTELKKVQ